jgi:hypothetical protein
VSQGRVPLSQPENAKDSGHYQRKNRRAIPHRLERCGYVAVKNPDAKDGLWKRNGERQVVYAKASLSPAEATRATAGQ